MKIYIPTYGRVGRQKTYNAMSAGLRSQTTFIIRPEEAVHYSQYNTLICDKVGVPAARQAAIDTCPENKIWFFDDDLNFSHRPDDWTQENYTLQQMPPEILETAMAMFDEKLSEYAIVGMDERAMNFGKPQESKEAGRIMRAFGVDKSVLIEENIRFDKYLFWEDFHVALSLFKLGYVGYISLKYLNNGTTNSKGGVRLYRDFEKLKTVRDAFIAEHAPFAVPVNKQPISWEGVEEWPYVPDVKIYWQKALEDARSKIWSV